MTAPTMRIARPGPGKGWRQTISARQAELDADLADLVLEEGPQRLDELELQVVGQPADVVVRLDVAPRPRRRRDSTTSGYSVPCTRNSTARRRARLGDDLALGALEGADELASDDLALLLGVAHAVERVEERLRRVDDLQRDAGRGHEVALDLLGLALAEQAVVDEHTGQLVADRALHQRCGDRRVDAAGQSADRPLVADLCADRARPAPRRR